MKNMSGKRDVEVWLWDVGSDLHTMHVEMLRTRIPGSVRRTWQPKADVFETGSHVCVKVELPGIRKEDIQVTFDPERHELSLRGFRNDHEPNDQSRLAVYQLEILHGEFERTVPLPRLPLQTQQIQAEFADGILRIHLPKRTPNE